MDEKIIYRKPPRSTALACILSIFFPGTGALYNRQVSKGIIFMVIIAGLITSLTQGPPLFVILLASLLLAGFYTYQILDSIQTAKSINRKALLGDEEEEVEVEEFPQAVKSGSVFWGIFLLALGGILLLANFDVISYDTVFDFWPAVIIIIGVKFIVDYVYKKNNSEN